MKNLICNLFLLLSVSTTFSQGLQYDIRPTYDRPVKKEILVAANTMSDLIPGYPVSWITDYISAEILVINGDKVMQAMGTNDTLNPEQKRILADADIDTEIVIDVNYNYRNAVTSDMDLRTMHYTATVIPEIEAEYPGGTEQMKQYLKDNAIPGLSETASKEFEPVIIRFTVNESGDITDARVATASGDEKINKMLLKVITRMPKWRPAENIDGIKVKQQFEFSVGNVGC